MEPRDFRTAIDAAEQAAAASDFASAERLLREAARLQEDALGPSHPDLANTLNNLGVVCENMGKADDAGTFYQRASEMAAATLPADHPFVATSRRNLEEFNRWRIGPPPPVSSAEIDRAFELGLEAFPESDALRPPVEAAVKTERAQAAVDAPRIALATAPPPAPPTAPDVQQRPAARPAKPAARSAAAPRTAPAAPSAPARLPAAPQSSASLPRWAIPALAAVAILAVVLMAVRPWAGTEPPADEPAPAQSPAPSTVPVAPETDARVDPAPPAAAPESSPPPAATAAPEAEAPPPPKKTPPAPAPEGSAPAATLAVAEVCQTLSTGSGAWRCDAVDQQAAPGRLAFYTRVRSPRNTTIEHRWFQGDRLTQTVTLKIGANSGAGYRTYSRQTVNGGSEWRVEARGADGTVLHEERFVVR